MKMTAQMKEARDARKAAAQARTQAREHHPVNADPGEIISPRALAKKVRRINRLDTRDLMREECRRR